MKKVSIIILNYNGLKFLPACLESVKNINYPNFEVIVIDNNSSDGSTEWLEKYLTETDNREKFHLIKNQKNLGFCEANNLAVKQATGDYLFFLNNDTKIDQDVLLKAVNKIESEASAGICACQIYSYTGEETYHTGLGMDWLGYPVVSEKIFYAEGSALLIRRDLFQQLNGFDNKFFMFAEDIDLAWRAWLLGYQVVVESQAKVYHFMGAAIGSGVVDGNYLTTPNRRYLSERNTWRMLLKNYSWWNLVYLLPIYFVINLIEMVWFLFQFKYNLKNRLNLAFSYLKVWVWNLINLSDTLKQRQRIQQTRKISDRTIFNKLTWQFGKWQALRRSKNKELRIKAKNFKNILINGLTLENANLIPVLNKAKYFQQQGCQIAFIGNEILKEKIDTAGILKKYDYWLVSNQQRIQSHWQLIFVGLKRNLAVLKLIKKIKGQCDIIYSCSSVLDLSIFPYILKLVDKRIFWATVFDNQVYFSWSGYKFLAWLFFKISLWLLKSADKIFVISPELKNFLIQHHFTADKLIMTGNALEVDLICQAEKSDNYKIDAIYVGRINHEKGVFDLLKILQTVKETYPNFQLGIVGEGDTTTFKKFYQQIAELKLTANIQFLGQCVGLEKFQIIKSSKVFLFPSYAESFGLALLEAVCCGLPALAYALPVYKNIYQHQEIYRFKIGDWPAVAEKVLEIFSQQNFINSAGEKLLSNYNNWDSIADMEYNHFFK